MYAERLSRLADHASRHRIDAFALIPGPNLFYLTGLSFHVSERPIVAFFPAAGTPVIVLPKLEAAKAESGPVELEVFAYTDEQGYATAFWAACQATPLAGWSVGVETLRMRWLEIRLLEQYAPGLRLTPADDALAELRVCKDAAELEQIREAARITEAALEATIPQTRVGITERALAALLMIEILRAGGEGAAFPPIVVAGPNAALPHAAPSDRPIAPGETIVIDCGASVGGYAADITRTFALGELEPELFRVYETVRAANGAGRAEAKPGMPAEMVDQATRAFIDGAGYGPRFIHRTGHGLGLEVHEPPYIVAGNTRHLEPGMVFTVEPGVYLPGVGGVRIEDDVVVTHGGAESLTSFPRELLAL
jgi:Xaa-Pro dipeptidase